MKKTMMALALCLMSATIFAGNRQVSTTLPAETPSDHETVERERIIREQVMLMGQPCAPLLIGVLWQNLSMAQIAKRLHYSNADSSKSSSKTSV